MLWLTELGKYIQARICSQLEVIWHETRRRSENFWLWNYMSSALTQWVARVIWVAHVLFFTGRWSYMSSAPPLWVARLLWVARYIVHFAGKFWRPSWCPNWACDSSFESCWSIISNTSGIVQFGVHLPCKKSNLPTLLPAGASILLRQRYSWHFSKTIIPV